nr:MAG TPA: hypothetical protein [Caudoviricetes sp.]DAW93555.1 MAG TPA: hypothetical protein [Bacteriophage sp.]
MISEENNINVVLKVIQLVNIELQEIIISF